MNEPIDRARWRNALLMNALVFPGSGYFFIGRRMTGWIVTLAAVTLLFLPLIAFTAAFRAALRQLSLHGPLVPQELAALAHAWHETHHLVWLSLAGIVLLWIYGMIDLRRQANRK